IAGLRNTAGGPERAEFALVQGTALDHLVVAAGVVVDDVLHADPDHDRVGRHFAAVSQYRRGHVAVNPSVRNVSAALAPASIRCIARLPHQPSDPARVPLLKSRMHTGFPNGSSNTAHRPTAISNGCSRTTQPASRHEDTDATTLSTR